MLLAMWFPDQTLQNSILAGLSLCHRQPPFLGPYLRCTFAMQHQFVCDTFATTSSLSNLVHRLEEQDQPEKDVNFSVAHKTRHCKRQSASRQEAVHLSNHPSASSSCRQVASSTSSWLLLSLSVLLRWPCSDVPKNASHLLRQASRYLTHPYLLLTYLTFTAYWPSLWAELVFDDRPAIIENKDLRWHTPWSQLWSNDYWGTPLKSPLSHKSYRPLTVLSFRLNYHLHQLQPFGYHSVNLLLHSLVSILFYRFCLLFLNESTEANKLNVSNSPAPPQQSVPTTTSPLNSTSLVVALLFAVHPIHTDCVSSVVGRAELLSALFYLAAILVWTTSKPEAIDLKNVSLLQLLLYHKWKLSAIPLALLGFLCKEQSILALVYLCLFELNRVKLGTRQSSHNNIADRRSVVLRTYWAPAPLRRKTCSYYNSGRSVVFLLLLLMSLLLAIYFRFAIMHHSLPTFSRFDNPASRAEFPIRHLTFAFLAVYHFWLLLMPLRLSCDWTHASIELIDFNERHLSLDLFRALCSLFMMAALAGILLRLIYVALAAPGRLPFLCRLRSVNGHKVHDNKQKSLHALALTLIPFVPASNLFFFTGFTIAERIMYLPSIGFMLLIAVGLCQLTSNWSSSTRKCSAPQHLLHCGLLALVVVFSMRTYSRSIDWSNEYKLYKSGLEVNPSNTKLLNNLGRLYEKDSRLGDAIPLYEKAIQIEPADIRSHLNLGNALVACNNTQRAEKVFRQALNQVEQELFAQSDPSEHLSRNPTISPLYLTALVRLAELINYDAKRVNLEHELEQIKHKMAAMHSMMTFNGKLKTPSDAHLPPPCGPHCRSTVSHEPIDRSFELNHLYNMAVLHHRQGHSKQALDYFERVLSLDSLHKDALLASAQIIEKENMERLSKVALERLNRLVQLGRDDATVYFTLAMLAAKANKHDQARQLFQKAIHRQPSFAEAHYNLALLLVKELDFLDRHQHQKKRHSNVRLALTHLKKVLTINPRHVKSMLVLGDLYAEELMQVETARRYYKLVTERVQPNHYQARHNLCVLWHKQNDLDQAIKCFEQLRQDLLTDLEHLATLDRIEKQIEVLHDVRRNQWSPPPRPQNKPLAVKWPKSQFCINESSHAVDEKLVNFKNWMAPNQLAAMCLI